MSRAHVRGKAGTNVTGDLYVSSDDEDINYITKERLSTRTGKIYARIHTQDRNSAILCPRNQPTQSLLMEQHVFPTRMLILLFT